MAVHFLSYISIAGWNYQSFYFCILNLWHEKNITHRKDINKSQMEHNTLFSMHAAQDYSGSSEEENSAAVAQSGRFSNKLDESDDDFNSNQLSPDTTTLSVYKI